MLRILSRKVDADAIRLRDKLVKYAFKDFQPKQGSYANELVYYNNRGIVYNFNDYKVGRNEDFCNKELVEICG